MGSPATCFSFEGDGLRAGGQQPLPWEPDFVALRVLDDEAEPDSKFAPAELFVLPAAVTTRDTETVCSPAVGALGGKRAGPPSTLLDLLACDDDDLTCLFENARPLAGAQARCIALIHSAGMYRGS